MEILEQIRRIVGCPLISDLRYGVPNRFAKWVMKELAKESYPLAELSDAVNYIFEENLRFESKQEVYAFLAEQQKPENTNKPPEPHKKRQGRERM